MSIYNNYTFISKLLTHFKTNLTVGTTTYSIKLGSWMFNYYA